MQFRIAFKSLIAFIAPAALLFFAVDVRCQEREVPDVLKPWEGWVTWDDAEQESPTLYRTADERVAVWPSELALTADQTLGTWNVSVTVFAKSWVGLPGDALAWPIDVKSGDIALPVVERDESSRSSARPWQVRTDWQVRLGSDASAHRRAVRDRRAVDECGRAVHSDTSVGC